uniref:Transposase n=1 Tax=Panagrellus redivivus TaxID=6233 RepID=A0A7E4UVB8_PANRE
MNSTKVRYSPYEKCLIRVDKFFEKASTWMKAVQTSGYKANIVAKMVSGGNRTIAIFTALSNCITTGSFSE